MPPAYYKYSDNEVIEFYSRIIESVPDCKIILYNFEKLCGYKFSVECVNKLVKIFPNQIVGVKDSTYNLYENLNLKDFSIFIGSELKLLKGLELGCAGIITATCNVSAELSRKVYDDFFLKKDQTHNEKLCNLRKVFDKYNLISGLHTFYSQENKIYKNILPPLRILNETEKKDFLNDLKNLNFSLKPQVAA
jgi:4-hydroxy-tetrahydrodipicolinate synthase